MVDKTPAVVVAAAVASPAPKKDYWVLVEKNDLCTY